MEGRDYKKTGMMECTPNEQLKIEKATYPVLQVGKRL